MSDPDRRPPLVDLHCHFVPGVDDGAPDLENALRYLEEGVEGGVTRVVATPHLPASRADGPFRRRVLERFRELEAAAGERLPGLGLSLAYEIRLDGARIDAGDRGLWLGPGGHVLVEYDRFRVPSDPMAPIRPILEAGLVPVLAHPERYVNAARVGDWIDGLREAGVRTCPNAVSLTGANGPDAARVSRGMLASGRADLLASDHHARPDRAYGLGAAWELVAGSGSPEAARVLMSENPAAVLEGRETVPAPEASLDDRAPAGDAGPGRARGGMA